MYPTVCIGPPKPWMKPAAHGTKHCQRYSPFAGVRKREGDRVVVGAQRARRVAHGFLASSGMPSSGTETPICGIANTCEAESGGSACVGLPSRRKFPPTVPCAWDDERVAQTRLRRRTGRRSRGRACWPAARTWSRDASAGPWRRRRNRRPRSDGDRWSPRRPPWPGRGCARRGLGRRGGAGDVGEVQHDVKRDSRTHRGGDDGCPDGSFCLRSHGLHPHCRARRPELRSLDRPRGVIQS